MNRSKAHVVPSRKPQGKYTSAHSKTKKYEGLLCGLVVNYIPSAGGWDLIPVQGTRSYMPQLRPGAAKFLKR